MIAIGIDPGPENSGYVVWNMDRHKVDKAGEKQNHDLLVNLRCIEDIEDKLFSGYRLFIETIEPMGLRVGRSTFDTMRWVGRFQEAWENRTGEPARLVSRGDEKIVLCGRKTYRDPRTGKSKAVSDAEIRHALINMFPPGKGTKKAHGPLYGVSGHAWSALAVVITGLRTEWKR